MTETRFWKEKAHKLEQNVRFDRKRRKAVQKQQREKVRDFQAKINEAFSPKTVIAIFLTRKQRGDWKALVEEESERKKERVKERGKGMTWGQKIERVRERRK